MQILMIEKIKNNEFISKYLIPIVCLPIIAFILKNLIEINFNAGLYLGTFIRAVFELVIKNA